MCLDQTASSFSFPVQENSYVLSGVVMNFREGAIGPSSSSENKFGKKGKGAGVEVAIDGSRVAPDFDKDQVMVAEKLNQEPVFWTVNGKDNPNHMVLKVDDKKYKAGSALQVDYKWAKLGKSTSGKTCFDVFFALSPDQEEIKRLEEEKKRKEEQAKKKKEEEEKKKKEE